MVPGMMMETLPCGGKGSVAAQRSLPDLALALAWVPVSCRDGCHDTGVLRRRCARWRCACNALGIAEGTLLRISSERLSHERYCASSVRGSANARVYCMKIQSKELFSVC